MSSSQVILWSTCPERNSTLNIVEVMVISIAITITHAEVRRPLYSLGHLQCLLWTSSVHFRWLLAALVVDEEKDETWGDQHDKEATDLQCKLFLLLQAHLCCCSRCAILVIRADRIYGCSLLLVTRWLNDWSSCLGHFLLNLDFGGRFNYNFIFYNCGTTFNYILLTRCCLSA